MIYIWSIVAIAIFVFVAGWISRSSQRKRRDFFKRATDDNDKEVAIRTYSKLGKRLQERYGVRDKYPPAKIKETIVDSGWGNARDCYGIAMYSDRADFIEYHRSIGEICDYDAMRSEISECLSLPDDTFSTSEAIAAGALFTSDDTPVYESSTSSNDGAGWSFWGSSDGGSSSSYDSGSSDSGSSDGGGGGD